MSEKVKDTNNMKSGILSILLTGIRIFVGWHFLYEGIAKIFDKNWTAQGFLLESNWIFSSFFHWIATHPDILRIVDIMNIVGLVGVGIALLLGIFTRFASGAGILLLLLYYIANPPLIGFAGEATSEGHYLLVNRNLIEMLLLLVFCFIPNQWFYGLEGILPRLKKKQFSRSEPDQNEFSTERREWLKNLSSLPFLGLFTYMVAKKRRWESYEELQLITKPSRVDAETGASPVAGNLASLNDLKEKAPTGKIGNLEISRLICGGNLIAGFAHSRDLIYVSSLILNYFSDERVLQTLHLCELCGINTAILRSDANTIRLLQKYRKRGGKIQWISQARITEDDLRTDIDASIDNGADAVYIQGNVSDKLVSENKSDLLNKAVEYIKKRGLIAGIGAHDLRVIITCNELGFEPDFYMKTLNSANYWTAGPRLIKNPGWKPDPLKKVELEFMENKHDNIWESTPWQTIEYMKTVKKPWIAFKVLGAGAIPPKTGFKYAYENGADFICAGMFDFQVVEDVNIVTEILKSGLQKVRPWMA